MALSACKKAGTASLCVPQSRERDSMSDRTHVCRSSSRYLCVIFPVIRTEMTRRRRTYDPVAQIPPQHRSPQSTSATTTSPSPPFHPPKPPCPPVPTSTAPPQPIPSTSNPPSVPPSSPPIGPPSFFPSRSPYLSIVYHGERCRRRRQLPTVEPDVRVKNRDGQRSPSSSTMVRYLNDPTSPSMLPTLFYNAFPVRFPSQQAEIRQERERE